MGEYFNGVKLGTCQHLMYVTREELERFAKDIGKKRNNSVGNLPHIKNYLDLECRWLYRFPREYEHAAKLEDISGRSPDSYIRLQLPADLKVPHRKKTQLRVTNLSTDFVETFNFDFCPMDPGKQKMGITPTKFIGLGEGPEEVATVPVQIIGNRYTEDRPKGVTVFTTECCGEWFTCSKEEIEEYILPYMLGHELEWEAQFVKSND